MNRVMICVVVVMIIAACSALHTQQRDGFINAQRYSFSIDELIQMSFEELEQVTLVQSSE
ncbi:MAG: hypothetical protein OCC49_10800 [Fibrobacterales bacterium]